MAKAAGASKEEQLIEQREGIHTGPGDRDPRTRAGWSFWKSLSEVQDGIREELRSRGTEVFVDPSERRAAEVSDG